MNSPNALDPPVWKLESLRAHIQSLGPAFHHLREFIDSMGRMELISQFHLAQARGGLKAFMSGSQDAETFFRIVGGGREQEQAEADSIAIEAHLIAVMHSVRNSFDIFSHLVNGLLLGGKIPMQACDIRKAFAALPASPFQGLLMTVLHSTDFKYVSGFVNTTKHRNMVKSFFKADFSADKSGIRVLGFSYGDASFAEAWAYDVLRRAFDLKNQIVVCGQSLNRQLGVN